MRLVAELKRRNVLRMAMLYVVAAWLVMQVSEVVISLAELPGWLGKAVIVMLTIGFPITLILSWFYELTPAGVVRDSEKPSEVSVQQVTGRQLDFIVIALLSAGLLLFAWDKWWSGSPPDHSVAVLPFVNLSAEESAEYLSDGITAELISTLADVPGLRTAPRSSSAAFKDSSLGIRNIAAELGVSYVLEGSVRKSGDQIRVTAQLIDAEDGLEIWSDSWDRLLFDVLEIQRDIAGAAVSSLRMSSPGTLPPKRQANPEAYDLYLRARHNNEIGTAEAWQQAERQLVRALAIDPEFAAGWGFLGLIYSQQAGSGVIDRAEGFEQARLANERAFELDNSNANLISGLAWNTWAWHQDYAEAGRLYRQGLDLAPKNTGLLNGYAYLLWQCSRDDEAEEFFKRAIAVRPQALVPRSNLVMLLHKADRLAEAEEQLNEIRAINPESEWIDYHAGNLALERGDAELAMEYFLDYQGPYRGLYLANAYLALGRTDDALAVLGQHVHQVKGGIPLLRAAYHAISKENDKAFELLEIAFRDRYPAVRSLPDNPAFDVLHDDRRWGDLLKRLELHEQHIAKACSQIPVTSR